MKNVRAHVTIQGRVQGVCFRMETQRAAKQRQVTGWVRNMADGRVEAVFEGDEAAVNDMLQWCETGAPMARVDRVDLDWEDRLEGFPDFRITY